MALTVKTKTRFIDDFEYEAVNESGNVVQIDMYPKENKKAQSPMELLLSAHAACAAVDLVQMLKKRRKTVQDLEITSAGQRKEDNPRAYTHISLHFKLTSPDAEQAELEKLTALAVDKYCSVGGTLGGVAIEFSCEIEKP
jgi:putative redox protein